MVMTRMLETGVYETPATTIGSLIDREWDNYKTVVQDKPMIIYDENASKIQQLTSGEQVLIRGGGRFEIPERSDTGMEVLGVGREMIIEVMAASERRRELFEFVIKSILRKYHPAGELAPLKKSNNTDISPICDFDDLPSFTTYDDGVIGLEPLNKSSTIFTVIEQEVYTP